MDFRKQKMAKSLKKIKKIKYKVEELKPYSDKRGWFAEMLKEPELEKRIKQVSVASTKPGQVRGNHYHLNKTEWFMVVGGTAEFCLVDSTTEEKVCFRLSGKNPKVITVFPKIAHAIKNIGKKMIYFIEVDSAVYNHEKPDAVPYLIYK